MNAEELDNQQLFPIGRVVEEVQAVYPDVTHSSLRFLEREGLIRSLRTQGRHRLYSRSDIDKIVQIKTWQGKGLSLDQIRSRLEELDQLPDPSGIAQAYVEKALSGDLAQAAQVVSRADEVGLPMITLFGDVLSPALHEIGKRWEHGVIPVAQEKEVSELSRELIVELTRRHDYPGTDGPVIVAACVEGEGHELGLRMICGLLRERGIRVYFLGADVAPRFLIEAVELHRPQVVLLSARIALTWPAVEETIAALQPYKTSDYPFDVIVGGDVAVRNAQRIEELGAIPIVDNHPASALSAILAVAQNGR